MKERTAQRARTSPLAWTALAAFLTAAIAAQVALDGRLVQPVTRPGVEWVRSPGVMRRLALGFDALWADVYWIRAVQYYGDARLSKSDTKDYDLLYPLLDMTTTLDPRFNIAYRFGAILLSEAHPNGPGRTDQAIALLEKGIRESPEKWEYYLDAGFVHYWWRRDARTAADWFLRASGTANAPNWLAPLAASVLAEAGDQTAARVLWTQLAQTAEHEWMRRTARIRLQQLDAEKALAQLQPIANRFYDRAGRFATGWDELVRAGLVKGVPLDPTGIPYTLDPESGAVDVALTSELFPLPRGSSLGTPQ
jgi:hypothetical protein